MSGISGAIGGAFGLSPAAPIDEISIAIGNTKIQGWQTVSITRSVEQFPSSFVLTASDQFPSDASKATTFPNGPGEKCQIFAGPDLLLTGFIDEFHVNVGPGHHEISIVGRGLCEDLLDCSADLMDNPVVNGGSISAANILDLAQKLCKGFGIAVLLAAPNAGKPITTFTVALGETTYGIIERIARYTQFLVYEDQNGALVLDQVGTKAMASGFTMPGNIESASSALSYNERFSKYIVVWNSVAQYGEISPIANQIAVVDDKTITRHRPRIINSEQYDPSFDLGKARANWELARRIGRSQAISLTTSDWRDSAGALWQPNMLAPINAPALKILNKQWIIGSVTFRRDQSGTHADLTLMPPDAFTPEPAPLYLWDREIMHSTPEGGAATPATAPPSLTGTSGLQGGGV